MSGQAETRAAPEIRGFIDGLSGNQIDGWAFEPAHPTERVIVELRLDGQAVATTVADRHRTDLVRAGIGDAFHGFRFPLKPEWAERRSDLAVVARGAAGGEASLQSSAPPCRARPPPFPPHARAAGHKGDSSSWLAASATLNSACRTLPARHRRKAAGAMPEEADAAHRGTGSLVARLMNAWPPCRRSAAARAGGRAGHLQVC